VTVATRVTTPTKENSMSIDSMIQKAAEMGTEAGKAAATHVFDGNTTEETYERVVVLYEDGDPALDAIVAEPAWLSGEWEGGLVPHTLANAVAGLTNITPEDLDHVCSCYEMAAGDMFWQEVIMAAQVGCGLVSNEETTFESMFGPNADREAIKAAFMANVRIEGQS